MTLSYGEGVALAIAISGSDIEARGRADRTELSARAAEYREIELLEELNRLKKQLTQEKADAVHNGRCGTAGFFFMRAVMEALETLPPGNRDKFYDEFMARVAALIQAEDREWKQKAIDGNWPNVTVQSEIAKYPYIYEMVGFKKYLEED